MILKKILILKDNYVWILYNIDRFCIIIDPGLSDPIIKKIKKNQLHPVAILLTHDHIDHTQGVKKIIEYYPKIIVFGPTETKNNNVHKIVQSGERITILNKNFYVFHTPGHTLGHVSYYSQPYLFCGDTLFSGGCGRVYKKNYLEMYRSIKFLSSFSNNTMLCCSHEYTVSNLNFARQILPNDNCIKLYLEYIKKIIRLGKYSLPSYILFERRINLFLRTNEIGIKKSIGLNENSTGLDVFIKLRLKKDFF